MPRSMSEEELYRQPTSLEALLPALGATTVPKAQQGAQQLDNLVTLLGITPVIGNAISAYDATQTGQSAANAFASGDTRGGLIDTGLTGLNAVAAVLGLPVGNAAKQVAKAGKDTVSVFLPAVDDALSDTARELRNASAKNATVLKKTGRMFSPEGRVLEEIPDNNMQVVQELLRPGMQTDLGRLVKHPELFDQMPALKRTPVEIAKQTPGEVPLMSSYTKKDGTFLLPAGRENVKGDLAKLIQYKISEQAGMSPAVRHSLSDIYERLASSAEKAAGAAPGGPSDLEALTKYLETVRSGKSMVDDFVSRGMPTKAEQAFGTISAGNVLAKRARNRANATDHSLRTNSYPLVGMESMLPLMPENLTPEQAREFIANWRKFGSGRGR